VQGAGGDAAAVLLIVGVYNLSRRGRIDGGDGASFGLVTAGGAVVMWVAAQLAGLERHGARLVSASGLVVLALAFTLVMLIYVLGQLTQLSNRVTSLAQELAIRRATGSERDPNER